jgi:hypothetical protein
MLILLVVYGIYLIFYLLISYAILYHLSRFRIEGDKSPIVYWLYIILSAIIIIGSLFFLRFA